MDVLPGERGRGVAAALVARLHQVADESAVAVTLLHYEQVQPAVRAVLASAGGTGPRGPPGRVTRASTLC